MSFTDLNQGDRLEVLVIPPDLLRPPEEKGRQTKGGRGALFVSAIRQAEAD